MSSTYSHSWHMNQSVSVHSSASSRVIRSSLVTSAAGYDHFVGDHLAIVDGMHYLVVHFVFHLSISLTHWGIV